MALHSKTGKALVIGAITGIVGLFSLAAANPTTVPSETPLPQQSQAVQAEQTVQPVVNTTPAVSEPVAAPAPAAAAAPAASSSGSGYTNVDGNHVNSPSSDPTGATAQCGDGTYSYSQHRSGTCSHHGGVARWL
jgi:hypothetical protein